jgi:hypothetical protein
MDQPLPRLSELFLGDDHAQRHADPDGDPAAWISPVSPYRAPRAIRLIGLVWILLLGLAAIAGRIEARDEASHPVGPARVAQVQPGPYVHTRLRSGANHRSHKRPLVVPKIALANDPSDDGTSGDPDEDDDDETSKFLNGSDDTDVPIVAWCYEMAPSPIPDECASATWTAPPSSPLLILQRLRC